MKILWLTWKDKQHPAAGGAEVVSSELGKRLVADGHELIYVTGSFAGAEPETVIDGYKVIRLGNRFSLYPKAYRYVRKHLHDWPDLVIEEINTIPFFSRFYLKKPRILFFHMLCRKIWFYQMIFPFSLVGWALEPFYLRLLGSDPVMTVSDSTRQDLVRYGFDQNNIKIISEGIQIPPAEKLPEKFAKPTIVSLGALRSMKRTLDQIRAFEIAKKDIPDLQLKISGQSEGGYGDKVLDYIEQSPYKQDIEYLGRVSDQQKRDLMQASHAITVTSVKEGWGLIVTEAASQGTPAAVYDVDGLRDSVQHGRTGLVAHENPAALAAAITQLLGNQELYNDLQGNAYDWSKSITFNKSYQDFRGVLSWQNHHI
jgi:glycosyltransferase involved in cell wall biosynthesis